MVCGAERGSGVDDTTGHDSGDAGARPEDRPALSGTGPATDESSSARAAASDTGQPLLGSGRTVRRGGPASSARTAVVWEVLSAVLAEDDPHGRGLDVVDAGGGSGGFAVPLAQAGHRVVVVDPSPDSLAALSRRAEEAGVDQRVRAVQGDVTDLPSALGGSDGVDLVLCHSVLEVVDDAAAALSAVAAVLRPGGRLSLLAPNRASAVLARALAGRPDEAAHVLSDPAGRGGPGDGPARRWEPDALRTLVVEAGLVVEQVHGVRVVADLVPSAVLDLEPGAAAALLALERALSDRPPFRDLATQLHVLAVRPAG